MALANQNTSFDSEKQLSVMQNWVTHGGKTRTHQSNTPGGIYGGRLLSVNQTHLAAFMAANCYLSIKTLIILLVGNKLYQQIQ